MRLVSTVFQDFHPFIDLPVITDTHFTNNPEELAEGDMLVVHGGADISPSLYNKKVSKKTGAGEIPSRRDTIEWSMIQEAILKNIPIVGICRGGQMLTAAAGGYLIQHVDGHIMGYHDIQTKDGGVLQVNSIHHQMMMPDKAEHELLAWSRQKRSSVYWDENNTVNVDVEPEYIYYPGIRGFAIQWHPEMMDGFHPTTKWVFKTIMERL